LATAQPNCRRRIADAQPGCRIIADTNLINAKLGECSLQNFVVINVFIVILGIEVYLHTAVM